METIPAKTLLGRRFSGEEWFGQNYHLNIYRGCSHGCIYCDSRSDCYRNDNFDTVKAKENALEILERELKSKRISAMIGTGAMSDPYNPCEAEAGLTRASLELLERYRFGVGIATKSDLVVRDIDVLLGISVYAPAHVKMTITTLDEALAARIEPRAPSPAKRLEALRNLSRAGIVTGILLMPVLPFLCDSDENVLHIVEVARQAGVRYIYPAFGMTMRDSQRAYFYDRLDELFPGLKERYIRAYGGRYRCVSPRARRLWELFSSRCREYGILYRMADIIGLIRGIGAQEQMTFF